MRIIDNINSTLGDDLKATLHKKSRLKIAASCFSIYAYEALKSELSQIEMLEFIFTAPAFVADELTDKLKKEQREFFIPKLNRERTLYGSEFEIQLRNKLTQKAIARECADWILRKAQFRSNKTKAPMQQFACVQPRSEPTVYMPLQGFTAVDLGYQQGNAVSNIVTRFNETSSTTTFLQLFDQIWNDQDKVEDVTAAVRDHIASAYKENSPEYLYFIILYNLFSEFLEDINEDVLPNDKNGYQESLVWKKLYNFQKDAATGIINKLETYNGCILADSVGLGKTFTALAVIKYYELRNRTVLVLCPKRLSDNWRNYNTNLVTNVFAKDRFSYDVLCHTDLSRTSGESFGISLNRVNWGNYDLLVIDESHNFRNNDAFKDRETRYRKLMNKVIRAGVKTKVLMLSATPVNNRFNDLRNQLALAYEGESENLSKTLRSEKSIEAIFRSAQKAFNSWSNLPPAKRTASSILDSLEFDFFELLDSVTIARSRKHILSFYDTSDIGHFPERLKPLSHRCPLSERNDVLAFNEIFKRLSGLTLGLYAPVSYILPSRLAKYEKLYDTLVEGGGSILRQVDRERSLKALMTVNLLKRLESSVAAFRLTLRRLQNKLSGTLQAIDAFHNGNKGITISGADAFVPDNDDEDAPEFEGLTTGGKVQISLADMDTQSWQRDLSADLREVEDLLVSMDAITPLDDAKLQHLKKAILDKISSPINPGNKKILLFTAFADTASYLYDNLAKELLQHTKLHSAVVTGSATPQSTVKQSGKRVYDFQSILTLFSPLAKEKAQVLPDEAAEIDLLIATDCISEGQNLQDCDYLINYDIHWNPVRIIQRFGRIDRIGSRNRVIQLANYWPDISLDEYINLKERVENRMMIADVSATGDDNVLTAQSSDAVYRLEQLRRLQEEVIDLEDVKTGVSITDLGLNDFRMDLLGYMKEHGNLESAPSGLHAVVPAQPEFGLCPGIVFVLRNHTFKPETHAVLRQQNRLHPYYLIYMSNDGQVVAGHAEAKKLLDLIRTSCKGHAEPVNAVCSLFNEKTQEGRDMKAASALLTDAIRSFMDVKEEKDINSLFSGGRTTALVNTIAGLDDFELIAFIVVQEQD